MSQSDRRRRGLTVLAAGALLLSLASISHRVGEIGDAANEAQATAENALNQIGDINGDDLGSTVEDLQTRTDDLESRADDTENKLLDLESQVELNGYRY